MSFIINPYRFGGAPAAPSGLSVFWMAGAEHESNEVEKWSTDPTSIQSGITDAHGRTYFVTGAVGLQNLASVSNPACAIVRFRPTINSNDQIIAFRENGTTHIWIRHLNTGAFQVARGGVGPPQLAVSSTGLMSIDNWYYAELLANIHDTTGSFTARLWDDTGTLLSTLTDSNVDTRNGDAVGTVDQVSFGGVAIDPYIDEIAIDLSGNQLGRCIIVTRYPTGNGDLNQWTRGGTDTGNNYDQVDEAVKDTTSYVQSTAADQYDFYDIDLTSLGGTMKALQVNVLGRSATGTVNFKIALRIGGVSYDDSGTKTYTSTTADLNHWAVWSDNPATGGAWTGSETVQIGIKSVTGNVRVHQCCAEILVGL